MSFDIGVWFNPGPMSQQDAANRYLALRQADLGGLESSKRLSHFVAELTQHFPQIDDVAEEDLDDCPWNSAFDMSGGHVIMSMDAGMAQDVLPTLLRLALEHGLITFNPQTGELHQPPAPDPSG